jgi:hypothetical protein
VFITAGPGTKLFTWGGRTGWLRESLLFFCFGPGRKVAERLSFQKMRSRRSFVKFKFLIQEGSRRNNFSQHTFFRKCSRLKMVPWDLRSDAILATFSTCILQRRPVGNPYCHVTKKHSEYFSKTISVIPTGANGNIGHVNIFVLGPAVINTHIHNTGRYCKGLDSLSLLTLLLARAPLLLATLLSHTSLVPRVHHSFVLGTAVINTTQQNTT